MHICYHDWRLIESNLIEAGTNKMFVYKCQKCGRNEIKTLDSWFGLPKKSLVFRNK